MESVMKGGWLTVDGWKWDRMGEGPGRRINRLAGEKPLCVASDASRHMRENGRDGKQNGRQRAAWSGGGERGERIFRL